MARQISMGARREITAVVSDHYRSAGWMEKGRILDELCKITGWHRKHAIRMLAVRKALAPSVSPDAPLRREPTYGATIKDALVALWEASELGQWHSLIGHWGLQER